LTERAFSKVGTSDRSAVLATSGPVRVGVAGATGFAGQELVRLMARHPYARITAAMASSASSPARTLPALDRIWEGTIVPFDLAALADATDVVFLSLPEDVAAPVAPALLDRGVRVIDLSGAFRLRDEAARVRWYPKTKPASVAPVYGLTERNRTALHDARFVTCPGCFPTAALLALAPLADAKLLAGEVVIDAKSGISGAGKTPSERTHFSECHGSVAAYGVLGHRHTPEIEQELDGRTVTFVPHLVPLDRGILETIYARITPGTTTRQLNDVMQAAWASAPFVRLRGETLPEIKHVAYSNFCDIGWRLDEPTGRVVMVSCLDNLVKGAAGQAVQNFNVMLGFDERAGLLA
jgi:N-acetyl-gamma-glutamyl-phosphate reductase